MVSKPVLVLRPSLVRGQQIWFSGESFLLLQLHGETSAIHGFFVSRTTPIESALLSSGIATASYSPLGTGSNFTSTLSVQIDSSWEGALVTCRNIDTNTTVELGRLIVQLVSKFWSIIIVLSD